VAIRAGLPSIGKRRLLERTAAVTKKVSAKPVRLAGVTRLFAAVLLVRSFFAAAKAFVASLFVLARGLASIICAAILLALTRLVKAPLAAILLLLALAAVPAALTLIAPIVRHVAFLS
jgi:hypothetical protein